MTIVKPDGTSFEAMAQITMAHRNIRHSEDVPVKEWLDQAWRIRIWFMNRPEADIPDGSQILVAPEIRDAILPPLAS